jgi:hypothetical protein
LRRKEAKKEKDKKPEPHKLQAVPLKATPVHLPVDLIKPTPTIRTDGIPIS